jgi:hypothetical protein
LPTRTGHQTRTGDTCRLTSLGRSESHTEPVLTSGIGLFDLLRDWLAARFAELGRGDKAEDLALHLPARAQGIALKAHVYHDLAFLAREAAGLTAWIVAL